MYLGTRIHNIEEHLLSPKRMYGNNSVSYTCGSVTTSNERNNRHVGMCRTGREGKISGEKKTMTLSE